jgi:Zn-dependent protease with chaperone function/type II secretory pathway pseudopilin PulG
MNTVATMDELVYPRERSLGAITLVLGIAVWIGLVAGTFGGAIIGLLVGFVLYLFAQSALIAHIKGNGVELSEAQFPDLHAHFVACCDRLQLGTRPKAYIINGNGGLNAFATRFLKTEFVVLNSDVVDAMAQQPDAIRFYIGHELGHLRMKHLAIGHLLRWPVLWLPLIGAAYSRSRETTCDRHGLACTDTPDSAARALAALSAGAQRWKGLDVGAYRRQLDQSSGFWMSFHELLAGYPWLTKRVARVMDIHSKVPRRNAFAYIPAIFVPYAGRLGAAGGFLILVYIVGIGAAIAIPAYQDYTIRAVTTMAMQETQPARDALARHYEETQQIPASLEAVGIASPLPDGTELVLNPDGMVLTVLTKKGELIFTPTADKSGKISWTCSAGEGLRPGALPMACRGK